MVNCFVCRSKKKDYEVWWNKLIIASTFDSQFQEEEIIQNMSESSMLCYTCIKK